VERVNGAQHTEATTQAKTVIRADNVAIH